MKRISTFALAAFAIVAVASCAKEIAPAEQETTTGDLVTMEFSATHETDTKATLANDYQVLWSASDAIAIIDDKSSTLHTFTLNSGAGTNNGKFTGEVGEGATEFWAGSPAAAVGTLDGNNLSFSLAQAQTVSTTNPVDPSALLSCAHSTTPGSLDFLNVVSLIQFTVKAEDNIKEVHLSGNNDEILAGTFTVNTLTGEVVTRPEAPNAYKDVYATAGGEYFADGTYYIGIVPTEFTKGLTLTFVGDDSSFAIKTSSKTATIARNAILNLGTVKPAKWFPVNIKTAADLKIFAENASKYPATANVTIANDIDMTDVTIDPAENQSFAGTLNGNEHSITNWKTSKALINTLEASGSISNLTIASTCSVTATAGTFGIIANFNAGTIENCTNNANIELGNYSSQTFLGAIVGGTSGLVKDCTNNGNINIAASTTVANSAFAGVVGIFEGEKGKVAVTGCTNTGEINYTITGTPKNPIIGGVVGCTMPHAAGDSDAPADRAAAAPNVGKITDCKNTGAITVKWDTNNTGSYTNLGGVVGYIEGDVENCTNKGAIKFNTATNPATVNSRPSVGGVAGYIMYSAKNLHNYGKVEISGCFAAGTNGAAAAGSMHQPCFGGVIGGIGYAYITSVESDEVCEGICNYGEINFEVVQKTKGGTKSNTGAVIGYCSVTTVKDCHNYGTANLCTSHKTNYVGGVIGLGYSLTVSDCTNEAELTFSGRASELGANTTNYFAYQTYAGGIIGYQGANCTFTNCINTGAIAQEDILTTAAFSYLGGVLGSYSDGTKLTMESCENQASINYQATASIILGGVSGGFNGKMTNCKNSGALSAPNGAVDAGKPTEIGGIIGYANAVVNNCTNTGNITTAASGSYAGGLFGGIGCAGANAPYASLYRQIESCTVDCTISGEATVGSIAGRFRNTDAKHYMYYKDMTLGAGVAELPVIGTTNGNNTMVEGDCPTA